MIDLILASERFYRTNPRAYHNYDHAKAVVRRVYELTSAPTNAVLLAAWWHDAIYFPGAADGVNENASAAALMSTHRLIQSKANDIDVDVARVLVEQTRMSVHLADGEEYNELAVLLDADLGGMAAPYTEFVKTQENIIRENYAELSPESYAKSAAFLKMMSTCREYLFHTTKGRELWEAKAMANIKQYCEEYA